MTDQVKDEEAFREWYGSRVGCANCGHDDTHVWNQQGPDPFDGHTEIGHFCTHPGCGCDEPNWNGREQPTEQEIFLAGVAYARQSTPVEQIDLQAFAEQVAARLAGANGMNNTWKRATRDIIADELTRIAQNQEKK